QGIIVRNLITGQLERYAANAVVLATGGYGNVFYLSTNAMSCNVTAAWRTHKRGAGFANPCFVQIHPTCIPVHGDYQSKLTLMSESLRNDGRVWVPRKKDDQRIPADIPEAERDYYLERKYPGFGNLVPRDVASRNAKEVCDQGQGVGETGQAVYLDFAEAIARDGAAAVLKKIRQSLSDVRAHHAADPVREPMMIYPAVHYTMGGLWVDYQLQSSLDGLFVLGEANFSDHGANRLGASALMQGLADGYFILPATLGNYLAQAGADRSGIEAPAFVATEQEVTARIVRLLRNRDWKKSNTRSVDYFHRKLGLLLWNHCGMARNEAGLSEALAEIPVLREEFYA
ncbi:FAD-binding protein, partial [Desulfobulbus sp. TB]|nr:FAD-binding protein [Desulfobulbus sp. TB]